MKSRWVGILAVSVLVLWVAGCSSSVTDAEVEGYGYAALQIQWPDEPGIRGGASGDATEASLSASDRQMAKAYVFDGCEAEGRDVFTILVEVRDDHEHHLVSESFECTLRSGEIKNIAVGPDRHFIVSALDGDGTLRYYGEKTGVAIEPGFNEVGVIAMFSVGDVIIPPEVTITVPEDGSAHELGAGIAFEGGAVDMEGTALTGNALVWTSDVDGVFGTGTALTFEDFSPGTHVITLTATDGNGETGESSISITVEEAVNLPPSVTIARPFEGSRYTHNENIFFEGEAEDPEDGDLSGEALLWVSDRDGVIGTGSVLVAGPLSAGYHLITLTATDSEGATGEDAVSITVFVAKLPDTGQIQSYTATFGEDSDYTLNPPSYTKLDESGRPLSGIANEWAMVRDNVTGLVWEVKTTDGSIHDNSNRYTWDAAGEVFIQTLNQNRFGGYDDWRLPTVMELYTIIHADNYSPAVNTSYFPNIQNVFNPWYLSSTPLDEYPVLPWVIDFNSGTVASDYGEFTELYARAVRGAVFQTGPFLENEDGTVTDTKTGLMWQQWEDPYGVSSWEAALNYCETFSLAGHSDWRLPNRHELHALVDYSTSEPAYPPVFDDNWASEYWASTSSPVSVGDAYTVEFYEGYGRYWGKMTDSVLVRCVRGGN